MRRHIPLTHSGSHHAAEPAREALLLAGPLILISTTDLPHSGGPAQLHKIGSGDPLWLVGTLQVHCMYKADLTCRAALQLLLLHGTHMVADSTPVEPVPRTGQ